MLMPGSGGKIAGSGIANTRDFKGFFPLTACAMTHRGVTKDAYLVACGRHAWTINNQLITAFTRELRLTLSIAGCKYQTVEVNSR